MEFTRRNTIIGLGALAGGGGIIAGTGAFDTVDADRDVTVEFDDDADAALQMVPAREGDTDVLEYVGNGEEDNGELGINLVNVNRNAVATITGLITFTNNTSQNIDQLSFDIDPDEGNHGEIRIIDPNDLEENAGANVLEEYEGDVSDDILATGQSVTALSLEVDTTEDANGGGDNLPNNSSDIQMNATITISTVAE